jgi:hypothetical protein
MYFAIVAPVGVCTLYVLGIYRVYKELEYAQGICTKVANEIE